MICKEANGQKKFPDAFDHALRNFVIFFDPVTPESCKFFEGLLKEEKDK